MPAMMRSDFPDLYAERLPYIKELIGPDDWPEIDSIWEQFFRVESSNRMREEFTSYAGFGLFASMGEGDRVTYDKMLAGPRKSISHTLYGLGFQVGFLASEDDLDGIVRRNAPELGRSMRMSVQTLAASFWNGAWDTYTTADGQTYFSTVHTFLRGGGTWSNRSTATLGQTALETGLISFNRGSDLMGNPQTLMPETLMIPPELEPLAYELLRSEKRHDTTTHAQNYLFGKLRPIMWPWLTISTCWAILGRKEDRKVYWFWRIRPRTNHGYDFDSETAKTKTLFSSSFGAVDARGAYGSKGS